MNRSEAPGDLSACDARPSLLRPPARSPQKQDADEPAERPDHEPVAAERPAGRGIGDVDASLRVERAGTHAEVDDGLAGVRPVVGEELLGGAGRVASRCPPRTRQSWPVSPRTMPSPLTSSSTTPGSSPPTNGFEESPYGRPSRRSHHNARATGMSEIETARNAASIRAAGASIASEWRSENSYTGRKSSSALMPLQRHSGSGEHASYTLQLALSAPPHAHRSGGNVACNNL
jgi:hypothetical protein